jgi:hypothetical protein
MIIVTLSDTEMVWPTKVGTDRHEAAKKANKRDSHKYKGSDEDGLKIHILGAAGELAFAKSLGIVWDASINTWKKPDLCGIVQVKTATHHTYSLLVRPDAKDGEIFVLVTSENLREYQIHGWMIGKDIKRERWLRNPGERKAAWFVPQSALHPYEDLLEVLMECLPELFVHR